MTQTRIWNYGDTFTSTRADTVQGALHTPGVYVGYDIVITDTDKIELTPGFLMLPSGIVVGENIPIQLILSPAPAALTVYTITVRHTDTDVMGGSAATYALETGQILPADVSNGLVLGYIRHPGAALPLDDSFIVPVRKVLEEAADALAVAPEVLNAPLASTWVLDVVGANTTESAVFSSPLTFASRIETSGLGPAPPSYETTTARIPLVARKFRPFNIVIRAQVDPNSSIVVSLTDTAGNSVTVGPTTISPSASFVDSTVSIAPASGVFTQGDPYLLTLEFRTPQSDSIDIQSVTINYDPLP